MSKKCLAVVSTKNPSETLGSGAGLVICRPAPLLQTIAGLKNFYPDFDILVVDSCSDINLNNIQMFRAISSHVMIGGYNQNYELGAWAYALRHYPDYKQYMFIQDTLVPVSRIKDFKVEDKGIFYSFECKFKVRKDPGFFPHLNHLENVYKDTKLSFFAPLDPETEFNASIHSSFISDNETAKNIVFDLEIPYELKKIKKRKWDSWISERTLGFMASLYNYKRIPLGSFKKIHGQRM